jgi:class 3 adenylate cyclase/predicted ATPase
MPVFLFTDIEGSSRLWEEHTGVMTGVIARHDEILREQVEVTGGRITKHTGDGITAVFQTAGQPLVCALETQKRFAAEPWGEIGELRIRAGLHAGEAEFHPSAGTPDGDYFGPPVNATARVMSAAWGGQILLTPEVTGVSPLPEQATLRDLGEHLLKNVSAPQQLYQLDHPQLSRHEFPPPRTLSGQAIRQAVDEQGAQMSGLEPQAMGISLVVATLLPALQGELDPESGALEGNLGVLEELGALSLRGFVAGFAERLSVGKRLPRREVQALLLRELETEWQAGGETASALRSDASRLLQAVHGVEAAVTAATDEVKEAMARGLADLGSQFGEFRWMLAGVQDTLYDVRALQLEQLDLQREQLAMTQELLERQAVPPALEIEVPAVRPAFLDVKAGEEERPLFVARERELARLNGYLERALSGEGLVTFVTGDPGRGKTMLITEFAWKAMQAHPELLVAKGNCNAYSGSGDPYLPFREILAMLSGDVEGRWAAGSISLDHARRLWDGVPHTAQIIASRGSEVLETFVSGRELLARAIAATGGDGAWLDTLREQVARALAHPSGAQQSRLFEQYARALEGIATHSPLLLIVDDLQWADPGSVALLFHLGRRLAGSRVLLAGAYRPEEVFPELEELLGEFKRQFGEVWVDLAAVDEAEARTFVEELVDSEPNRLGGSFRHALLHQTGGHALFSVELLRALQDRGDLVQDETGAWAASADLDWATVPARVEGVIEKRVGRLDADLKQALAVASVEGEVFTAEVVAQVENVDSRSLVRRLSSELDREHRLVRAEGIRRVDGRRLSRYRFRHNLFQRYMYDSLDDVERTYLHEDVGQALEELYEGDTGAVAAELALHFQEADIPAKAITYLQQAGEMALRLSANPEAVPHFSAALELLPKLPETPESVGLELSLQVPLSVALMNIYGYSHPEVGQAFRRAQELCEQIGETPQLAPVLHGLWAYYFVRTQYETAMPLAEQLLRLAPDGEQPAVLLMAGHNDITATLCMLGRLEEGMEHATQVLSNYHPSLHEELTAVAGDNLSVTARSWQAFAWWLQGYPDRSLRILQECYEHARELDHANSIGFSLFYKQITCFFRREVEMLQAATEEEMAHATEYGLQQWQAYSLPYTGWALGHLGQLDQGLALMHQALATLEAIGSNLFTPMWLSMLAELYDLSGQTDEALTAVDDGLAFLEETGERFYEPELHRLKGQLILTRDGDATAAGAHYMKAIEVARAQGERFLELRATVSLCRLWQAQGRHDEARERLAAIYDWFTEGFDTPDLVDARALLDELS